MVVNVRPLKRMKSRVTADLYDFLTFPSLESVSANEPFRTNVRAFLSKYAMLPPPSSLFPHLLTWQIQFRVGDAAEGPDWLPTVVCLDIIEEDVAISRSVYCDQCRVVGELTHWIVLTLPSYVFLSFDSALLWLSSWNWYLMLILLGAIDTSCAPMLLP